MRIKRLRAKKAYENSNLVKDLKTLSLKKGAMLYMLAQKKPGIILLAKEGTQILGWAFLMRIDTAFEVHVYVDPTERRKGFGNLLLKRAKQEARRQHRAIYGYPASREKAHIFNKNGIRTSKFS